MTRSFRIACWAFLPAMGGLATPGFAQIDVTTAAAATSPPRAAAAPTTPIAPTAMSGSALNTQILNQARGPESTRAGFIGQVPSLQPTTSNLSVPSLPGIGGSSKPFAGVSRGSTLSPYLNLSNRSLGSPTDNYNTIVRPQLEQQQMNQALRRQQQQLNTRVQQISAQSAFQAAGSEQFMATGHQTTFGFYSRFYPALNRRR